MSCTQVPGLSLFKTGAINIPFLGLEVICMAIDSHHSVVNAISQLE
jgi:hypothetical protein